MKVNQVVGGGFLLWNNQFQGVYYGGYFFGGEWCMQLLKQFGYILGKVLWWQYFLDIIFIMGQKLVVGIDCECFVVMFIDMYGFFVGIYGGKFCFVYGVEWVFSWWLDGIVNGFMGGFFVVLCEGIILVIEDWWQGNNVFICICGCGGFFLVVIVEVMVSGKDNLIGGVFLLGKVGQRKEVY